MSRYDKYDPKVGGYRATLAADFNPDNLEKCLAVGHDVNGHLVVGAGVSGIKAVLVLTKAHKAGKRVDPMTRGEIVEFGPSDVGSEPGVDFGDPGTDYYGHNDGTVTATQGADGVYVGHTVEGHRLIVNVSALASEPAVVTPGPGTIPLSAIDVGDGIPLSDIDLGTGIPVTSLETTGTPSASTYLDGTGAWSTPA